VPDFYRLSANPHSRFVRQFAPLLASTSSERSPSENARKRIAGETTNELRFLGVLGRLAEGEARTVLITYEL
jgi:hypothetical protein